MLRVLLGAHPGNGHMQGSVAVWECVLWIETAARGRGTYGLLMAADTGTLLSLGPSLWHRGLCMWAEVTVAAQLLVPAPLHWGETELGQKAAAAAVSPVLPSGVWDMLFSQAMIRTINNKSRQMERKPGLQPATFRSWVTGAGAGVLAVARAASRREPVQGKHGCCSVRTALPERMARPLAPWHAA